MTRSDLWLRFNIHQGFPSISHLFLQLGGKQGIFAQRRCQMKARNMILSMGTVIIISLLFTATSFAESKMPKIFKEAGCMMCHSVAGKLVGHGFAWVADKYNCNRRPAFRQLSHDTGIIAVLTSAFFGWAATKPTGQRAPQTGRRPASPALATAGYPVRYSMGRDDCLAGTRHDHPPIKSASFLTN